MMTYRTSRGAIIAWRQPSDPYVPATAAPRPFIRVRSRGQHVQEFGVKDFPPPPAGTLAPRFASSARTRGQHIRVLTPVSKAIASYPTIVRGGIRNFAPTVIGLE